MLLFTECHASWQDGVDRGWFRTNRSAIHGLPDLVPILATAREVASGMAHLHSMNILHGDLTSLNVLLTSSDIDSRGFIAKVSPAVLNAYNPCPMRPSAKCSCTGSMHR